MSSSHVKYSPRYFFGDEIKKSGRRFNITESLLIYDGSSSTFFSPSSLDFDTHFSQQSLANCLSKVVGPRAGLRLGELFLRLKRPFTSVVTCYPSSYEYRAYLIDSVSLADEYVFLDIDVYLRKEKKSTNKTS